MIGGHARSSAACYSASLVCIAAAVCSRTMSTPVTEHLSPRPKPSYLLLRPAVIHPHNIGAVQDIARKWNRAVRRKCGARWWQWWHLTAVAAAAAAAAIDVVACFCCCSKARFRHTAVVGEAEKKREAFAVTGLGGMKLQHQQQLQTGVKSAVVACLPMQVLVASMSCASCLSDLPTRWCTAPLLADAPPFQEGVEGQSSLWKVPPRHSRYRPSTFTLHTAHAQAIMMAASCESSSSGTA